jgi:hypothetical protein
MMGWGSYSAFVGPIVVALALGLFVLILRWSGRRGSSVVAAPAKKGAEADYGLLTVVSRPATYIEGEIQRRTLEDAGIRATLVYTLEGPRLMVFPADQERAKRLVKA